MCVCVCDSVSNTTFACRAEIIGRKHVEARNHDEEREELEHVFDILIVIAHVFRAHNWVLTKVV